MKKVIRLNENDIKILVGKIISEEKKSINEGPLKWIRKKFNQDEEVGLLIIKALESGDIENVQYAMSPLGSEHVYTTVINGHRIQARFELTTGINIYTITVDGEVVELSGRTKKKIFRLMAEIEQIPTLEKRNKKLGDIKTSLNRYNLPAEERKSLENPETFFGELDLD